MARELPAPGVNGGVRPGVPDPVMGVGHQDAPEPGRQFLITSRAASFACRLDNPVAGQVPIGSSKEYQRVLGCQLGDLLPHYLEGRLRRQSLVPRSHSGSH